MSRKHRCYDFFDRTCKDIDSTKQELLLHSILNAVKLHCKYVNNLIRYLSNEAVWDLPTYTRCDFGRILKSQLDCELQLFL